MSLAYESRMKEQDLFQYLKSNEPLCLHLCNVTAYSGYVRIVKLRRAFLGVEVHVEFEPHRYGEGGAHFMASFTTLPLAINILEQYFDTPLSRWKLYHPELDYPTEPTSIDLEKGTLTLAEAIKTNTVLLPVGRFELVGDDYWRQLVPR
jgi:hypothetical protein